MGRAGRAPGRPSPYGPYGPEGPNRCMRMRGFWAGPAHMGPAGPGLGSPWDPYFDPFLVKKGVPFWAYFGTPFLTQKGQIELDYGHLAVQKGVKKGVKNGPKMTHFGDPF